MEPSPGAVPKKKRIRRQPALFPLSSLWGTAAVFISVQDVVHLEPPSFRIDGFGFCRWIPARPRYMHQFTYRRYLIRFLRYQEKHAERQVADMLKLLGMFK